MDKGERRANKQGKRKVPIGIGGANLGGLVASGGALAVAGLVVAFAVKKCIKRDVNVKKVNNGSQGMRFILQSSPDSSCSKTNGSTSTAQTQTGSSSDLVSGGSLISEENPTSMSNVRKESSSGDQQEIMLTDESKQGNVTSCDDCTVFESSHKVADEFSSPELDGSLMNKPTKEIENESGADCEAKRGIELVQEQAVVVDYEKVNTEKIPFVTEDGFLDESKQKTIAYADGCAESSKEFTLPKLDCRLMNEAKSEINNESREEVMDHEKVTTEKNSTEIEKGYTKGLKLEFITSDDDCSGCESRYRAPDEFALTEFDGPSPHEGESEINEVGDDLQLMSSVAVWKEEGVVDSEDVTPLSNSIEIDVVDELDDTEMGKEKSGEAKNTSFISCDEKVEDGWLVETREYTNDEVGDEQDDTKMGKEQSGEAKSTNIISSNEKVEDGWLVMETSEETSEDTSEEEIVDAEKKAEERSSLVYSNKEIKEETIEEDMMISTENNSSVDYSEVDDWEEEDDDEEEEDSIEEFAMQKGYEASEEEMSTSPESNAEAIWPVEVIEAFPMKLQKTTKDLGVKIVPEAGTTEKEELGEFNSSTDGTDGCQATENLMSLNETDTQEVVELNYQAGHSTRWRIWVWSTSAVLLLVLLWLAHYSGLSYHVVNREPALIHDEL